MSSVGTSSFGALGQQPFELLQSLGSVERPEPSDLSLAPPIPGRPTPGNLSDLSLSLTSLSLDVQVQTTTLLADAGEAGTSLSTDENGIEELLEEFAPELLEEYLALRDLISHQNPDAADRFDNLLRKVAKHLHHGQRHHGPDGQVPPAVQFRQDSIHIAAEASIVDLQVKLDDGTEITAQVVQLSFEASFTSVLGEADPLVLDLNGNGEFDVSRPEDGHLFDITGNGTRVQTATAINGDGLLALDKNNNGIIDSGKELFGDQNGAANGFQELGNYDSNSDGRIDAQDIIFNRLKLFRDFNKDGETDPGELSDLTSLGVKSLLLDPQESDEVANGNQVPLVSSFIREDNSHGRLGDLLFSYLA